MEQPELSQIMRDLLAMDSLARRYGCGLNPRLRVAVEADLRFPARAASPQPSAAQMQGPFAANVTRLAPLVDDPERKEA